MWEYQGFAFSHVQLEMPRSIQVEMPSGQVSLEFLGKIRTRHINEKVTGVWAELKAMDGIRPDGRLEGLIT